MVDNLALFLVHGALALLLLEFMRHDDPEDPPRRGPGRFPRPEQPGAAADEQRNGRS